MTDSVSDRLRRSAQNEQTSIELNRLLEQERAEKERLRGTLAHVESQILYRDDSMPEWAVLWDKHPYAKIGQAGVVLIQLHCVFLDGAGGKVKTAPDYRPNDDGPITLAIIDPPEG